MIHFELRVYHKFMLNKPLLRLLDCPWLLFSHNSTGLTLSGCLLNLMENRKSFFLLLQAASSWHYVVPKWLSHSWLDEKLRSTGKFQNGKWLSIFFPHKIKLSHTHQWRLLLNALFTIRSNSGFNVLLKDISANGWAAGWTSILVIIWQFFFFYHLSNSCPMDCKYWLCQVE